MLRFDLAGGRCEGLYTVESLPEITASCQFDIKHRNAPLVCVLAEVRKKCDIKMSPVNSKKFPCGGEEACGVSCLSIYVTSGKLKASAFSSEHFLELNDDTADGSNEGWSGELHQPSKKKALASIAIHRGEGYIAY